MISAQRRVAICDILLAGCSITVLVLSLYPAGAPQRTVEVRNRGAQPQRYSLQVDDPRLRELELALASWSQRITNHQIRVAKWQSEIAAFYADRTKAKAQHFGEVVQASFTDGDNQSSALTEAERFERQHQYWIRLREAAGKRAIDLTARLRQERSGLGPPVVLGPATVTPRREAPVVALCMGLLGAAVFGWRSAVQPKRRVASERDAIMLSSAEQGATALRLVIPAAWVSVHQEVEVKLRGALLVALVLAAMICMLAV